MRECGGRSARIGQQLQLCRSGRAQTTAATRRCQRALDRTPRAGHVALLAQARGLEQPCARVVGKPPDHVGDDAPGQHGISQPLRKTGKGQPCPDIRQPVSALQQVARDHDCGRRIGGGGQTADHVFPAVAATGQHRQERIAGLVAIALAQCQHRANAGNIGRMRTEFTPTLQRERGARILVRQQCDFGGTLRERGIHRQPGRPQIAFGGTRIIAILECEFAFQGRAERIIRHVLAGGLGTDREQHRQQQEKTGQRA